METNISKQIVVIRDKESVIVRSIEMKLKELGNEVIFSGIEMEDIKSHLDEAIIFIMYLPSSITEKLIKMLVFVSDAVRESGKLVITIGDKKYHDDLEASIPGLSRNVWLDRPLNMEAFTDAVTKAAETIERTQMKKTILLIDDDPTYAKMVREWMKDDYKVVVVTSGMQGITFLGNHEVDLILLDYEMPIVDGPQVLQMLRENAKTATIPVMFLTGIGTKESVSRVLALKPKGYILKSTTRPDLMKQIGDFFELKK